MDASSPHSGHQSVVLKKYPYRQLEYDEFRLVEIQPADDDSMAVKCLIQHLPRLSSGSVDYIALSYTWGDLALLKQVAIDTSYYLEVSANCYAALRRFRSKEKTVLVWIDAMCINQEDVEERTKQVRKMGQIYTSASQVLVYLGDEADDSGRIFEHIQGVCSRRPVNGYPTARLRNLDLGRHCDEGLIKIAWAIMRRPWFSRVWVLQEVFLGVKGKADVVVVCGPHSASLKDLANCCEVLCSEVGEKMEYVSEIPYVLTIAAGGTPRGLHDILRRTRHANATDPRDKFLGLLAMVDDERVSNIAGYHMNTTTVYTQVGLFLLQSVQLELLQSIRHPHSRYPNLASWMPDWSCTEDSGQSQEIQHAGHDCDYRPTLQVRDCCRSSSHSSSSDHEYHPVLKVKGFKVSRIESLGEAFNFLGDREECLVALKSLSESVNRPLTPHLPGGFTPDSRHISKAEGETG